MPADTTFCSVFRNAAGRTCLACNAGAAPRVVTFSDGTTLAVPGHALAQEAP